MWERPHSLAQLPIPGDPPAGTESVFKDCFPDVGANQSVCGCLKSALATLQQQQQVTEGDAELPT